MALIPASLAHSETTLRRLVILVLLYCVPASQALVPLVDPDIWWHFRTGQWIFSQGQVPTTDPFSAYGMGKPWVAYSWLFEILVYALFTRLGLIGILVFTVSMSLLIALVLHGALRRMGLPGDQRIERSLNTWSGLRGWESDPELTKARLVIGGVNHALTSLIRTDSRFKLVYEDGIAAVFVASTDGVESN